MKPIGKPPGQSHAHDPQKRSAKRIAYTQQKTRVSKKPFQQWSAADKDIVLEALAIEHGLIDVKG